MTEKRLCTVDGCDYCPFFENIKINPKHIDNMQKLRDGVNYMAYAQQDPLNAYINLGV